MWSHHWVPTSKTWRCGPTSGSQPEDVASNKWGSMAHTVQLDLHPSASLFLPKNSARKEIRTHDLLLDMLVRYHWSTRRFVIKACMFFYL